MPDYTDTNVSNLIINVLDSEKYDELRTGGELSESQLYLVTDDALNPSTTTPIMDGTASTGSETAYARGDHIHPTDTSRAPLASPIFTGTPTAPTATAGTSSTQIATTEFVQNAVGSAGGGTVTSVQVQATSPVQSSQNTAQSTSLNTTISLADGYGDTKNPYGSKTANYVLAGPTSGSAAAPTFRALTKADISDLGADVFIAEYGTTTYAQVTQALTDGKIVFAHRNETGEIFIDYYLPLTYDDNGYSYRFTGIFGYYSIQYDLLSDSSWVNDSTYLSYKDTTWYGTCSTTASTAQKAVSCTGYKENTGNILGVLFSTANTAATPTLNVNSTGAKSIYVGNSTPNSTTNVLKWSANTMVYFMFDGTYYRYITSVSAGSVVPSRGANTWSGSCITTANTADKVVSCDNFVLTKGAIISVHCSTANTYTANKITLNVNSTGAKDIYINMGVSSGTNALLWDQNETVTFIYDGTYYRFVCKTKPILSSSAITDALGYTPYNSTNPSGYTSNTGTVTGVTAGAGLNTTSNDTSTDGGTISSSGTLYLTKSGVTAGTYQGITVDKYGRVTSASDQGYITSAPVTSVNTKTGAVSLSASDVGAIADPSTKSNGQVLTYNGSSWVAQTPSIPDPAYIVSYNETVNWSEVVAAYNANIPIYMSVTNSNTNVHYSIPLTFIHINNSSNPSLDDYMLFVQLVEDGLTESNYASWDGSNGWLSNGNFLVALSQNITLNNGDMLMFDGSDWNVVTGDSIVYSTLPSTSSVLKGDSTNGISAATAGTDYAPGGLVITTATSSITSLSALQTQMATWFNATPQKSVAYYYFNPSGTWSPFYNGWGVVVQIVRATTGGNANFYGRSATNKAIIATMPCEAGTWGNFSTCATTEDTVAVTGDTMSGVLINTAATSVTSTGQGSITISHGTSSNDAMLVTKRTDTNRQLGFGIGSGGSNSGIYDYNIGSWVLVSDGSSVSVKKLGTPSQDTDAANKKYVDDSITAAIGTAIATSY